MQCNIIVGLKIFDLNDPTHYLIVTPFLNLFDFALIFVIPLSTTAATTITQAFNDTDDWNAKEESHQPAKFCNELNPILRKVSDSLILEWRHVKLQNNGVDVRTRNRLPGAGC